MKQRPHLPRYRASQATAIIALASLLPCTFAQAPLPAPVPSPPSSAPAAPPATPSPSNAVTPAAPSSRHARQAEEAYLTGARLLDKKDLEGAAIQFQRAVLLSPNNATYLQAAALLHEHQVTDLVQQAGKARILGQNARADALLAQAAALDPHNSIVSQHLVPGPIDYQASSDPYRLRTLASPLALKPSSASRSFHLRADSQEILRQVASAYGIRTVFDSNVKHDSIRFDIDDATYEQAIPVLLQMNHLFAVPLDSASILIAPDTAEDRLRLVRQVEETIFMPGLTNEQMGEIGNVVKNVFDLKQVTTQNSSGTLVVRTPQALLEPINLTLADLIDGGAQVMVDIKLYAVDKSRITNIGLQAPQQVGIYNVDSTAASLVQQNQSIVQQAIAQGVLPANASNVAIALFLIASGLVQSTLLSSTVGIFGGGLTLTGITTNSNLNFNLALTTSDTRAIDSIQVRVGDRQTATFRAGTRYPITTSTYSSGISSTTASAAAAAAGISPTTVAQYLGAASSFNIPIIQYEDLGVTFKAVPTVQKSGFISMHLDLKIEALAGGSIDNIPVLASRQFVSDVTVPDGQTALLASSVTRSEANAISGYPGLGDLPGFQQSLSDTNAQTSSSELLLLVTPHVVRQRSPLIAGPPIHVDIPEIPD